MNRRLRVLFIVMCVTVGGMGVAAAQDGALVVDDDGAQCNKATHTSIQAAVQDAAPGQVVWVCPGVYEEEVDVDKPLVVRGVHYGDAGQRCNNPAALADPTLDAILQVPPGDGAHGFDLLSDNVTVSGMVIQGGLMGTGIYTSPEFAGYRIDRNVIDGNEVGIELHSDGGSQSTVTQNCLRNAVGVPTMAGTGLAIWSHEGLINAALENNRFAGNTTAAIDLSEDEDDTVVRNVRVQRNESASDASFLHAEDAEALLITQNTVRQFGMGGGIVIEANNDDVLVAQNTLRSGMSPALQTSNPNRMDPNSDDAPSTRVRFERNTSEAAANGVALQEESAAGVVVAQNHIIANTGDGVVVRDGNSGNRFQQNHVRENGEDGIHLEAGADNNTLEQNSSFGNANLDCSDDGSGNTWTKNQGETSNPPGICTPNGS